MRSLPHRLDGWVAGLLAPLLLVLLLAGTGYAASTLATVSIPDGTALYAVDPAPMTVAECGRCHRSHFLAIKQNGGKHRIDCQACHMAYHVYNPRRDNYAAIMPQCASCHPLVHGEKHAACLGCHDNPHAPRLLQNLQQLSKFCGDCHRGPSGELAQFPSAHTKQACVACHSERHGRIPVCAECHQTHYAGQPADSCLTCHPVHKPLQISFTATTAPINCSTCHAEAYGHWTATKSKHGKVNCTACHTRHALIPACVDCHKAPHDAKMLARFKGCLECHLDPHDPPVK